MATENVPKPHHLEPSSLGTKDYWDNLYTHEITNHTEDPTDEGTIWFDDSSAEDKVVAFLNSYIAESKLHDSLFRHNCSFLDLGTGNGHLLFRLREGQDEDEEIRWGGRMLGVDYSQKSVEFAKRIAREKGLDGNGLKGREVEFRWWDIMNQSPSGIVLQGDNEHGWDVVLDKGTFDAISLSKEEDGHGRRICEGYKERILPLIKEGGILLITSCNWTEDELKAWFHGGELEFKVAVKYKSFSFGGKKGQTISSLCFTKGKLR